MSDMSSKVRHRRFKMNPGSDVQFLIETPTGQKHTLKIDNISLSGVGTISDTDWSTAEGLESGAIIPAAKIKFDTSEFALGRMVLRSVREAGGKYHFAFSAIDSKVPVDSSLSKYFTEPLDDHKATMEFELSPEKFSMANFVDGTSTNVDLFAKVHHFNIFMKDWEKSPKFSYKNVRLASMGERVRLAKKRKNGREDYIIMGSNDYLGLASHPEVKQAAKDAIDKYGFGSTGSPVTTGITDLHVELTNTLARMMRKEKAILFNSGYTANVGLISGLLHPQDLVVADMLSHASIQDGMQMSRGTSRFFKHNSPAHLRKILAENRDQYSGCLVITEGVFSMDGDVAPLDEILKIAREFKARVMVDEAHSLGVIGQNGLGACEKYNAFDGTDLIMGTFSKICGGIGGFVAASEEVVNWLYSWSRSHVFSVSIPPSTAAAALKALQIFEADKTLLQRLRANIQHFKNGLASLGYHLPADHESAVIPVVVGNEKKLETMNQVLMESGVFVVPIVYPAVSRNNCRFRFTVMSNHTTSDLDYVLNVLELAMERAQFKFEKSKDAA